jgi:hypothetical protein
LRNVVYPELPTRLQLILDQQFEKPSKKLRRFLLAMFEQFDSKMFEIMYCIQFQDYAFFPSGLNISATRAMTLFRLYFYQNVETSFAYLVSLVQSQNLQEKYAFSQRIKELITFAVSNISKIMEAVQYNSSEELLIIQYNELITFEKIEQVVHLVAEKLLWPTVIEELILIYCQMTILPV